MALGGHRQSLGHEKNEDAQARQRYTQKTKKHPKVLVRACVCELSRTVYFLFWVLGFCPWSHHFSPRKASFQPFFEAKILPTKHRRRRIRRRSNPFCTSFGMVAGWSSEIGSRGCKRVSGRWLALLAKTLARWERKVFAKCADRGRRRKWEGWKEWRCSIRPSVRWGIIHSISFAPSVEFQLSSSQLLARGWLHSERDLLADP